MQAVWTQSPLPMGLGQEWDMSVLLSYFSYLLADSSFNLPAVVFQFQFHFLDIFSFSFSS